MGTRSAIALPYEGSWRGRYVHWDGYPTHMGADLQALVQRDGFERVVKVLTSDHYGWSSIDADQPDLSDIGFDLKADYPCDSLEYKARQFYQAHGDGRFVVVPGYGIAYTEEQGQSSPGMWVEPVPERDMWTEWAYLLTPDSMTVLENRHDDGWLERGTVRWDTGDVDWSAFERSADE